eukprot:SAG31_NODE_3256_length_4485_cov_2.283402_1_plen_61_part_00
MSLDLNLLNLVLRSRRTSYHASYCCSLTAAPPFAYAWPKALGRALGAAESRRGLDAAAGG